MRISRLVLSGVLLSVAFVALFAVGFALLYHTQERDLAQAAAQGAGPAAALNGREELLAISTILVLLGLYGVQFLAALLGLFLGAASVSPEIDSGALHAVLARPLSRMEYLLGRFLALAGLLVAYVLVMSVALLLVALALVGALEGAVIADDARFGTVTAEHEPLGTFAGEAPWWWRRVPRIFRWYPAR